MDRILKLLVELFLIVVGVIGQYALLIYTNWSGYWVTYPPSTELSKRLAQLPVPDAIYSNEITLSLLLLVWAVGMFCGLGLLTLTIRNVKESLS
jgi:hypothetical protein